MLSMRSPLRSPKLARLLATDEEVITAPAA